MVVRLRLARFGRTHLPFYRIFVADSRAKRDGRHLEVVGYYNPAPQPDGNKHLGLNIERIKYWLAVGAQPTDRVEYLLSKIGLIPKKPRGPTIEDIKALKPARRRVEDAGPIT